MAVAGLDHVNIRVADVAATFAFYRDALGMEAGGLPGMDASENGGWIRDTKGDPIIHVGRVGMAYPSDGAAPPEARSGSGAVHHVALNCTDRPAMSRRLADLGIAWTENHVPQVQLRQMFVTDPNGILLELNFLEP